MRDFRSFSNTDLRKEILQLLNFRKLTAALFVGFKMSAQLMQRFSDAYLAFDNANTAGDSGKARAHLLDQVIHVPSMYRDLKQELWSYLMVSLDGLDRRVRQYRFDADLMFGRVSTIKKDIEDLQAKMRNSVDLLGLGEEFRLIEKKLIDVEERQASRIMAHKRAREFARNIVRPFGRTGNLESARRF